MEKTQVKTRYGYVRGTVKDGVRVWRGIPFAEPPVGDLRFRAPQEPKSWEGVKEAVDAGPIAMQPVVKDTSRMSSQASGDVRSEDCLYLNIWAPGERAEAAEDARSAGKTDDREEAGCTNRAVDAEKISGPGERKPVMVWFHGGAFVSGAGSLSLYDGTSFVNGGEVVLVTVNYRLGPFGFLHLSPFGAGLGSNLGLLDQVAALRWVRENIAGFGGDPERVTIFGESAGAMSIAALLAMPSATGLFRRAILQSGAAQVMPPKDATKVAQAFLAELGAASSGMPAQGELAAWLGTFTADEILDAGERLKAKLNKGGLSPMLFQPVLDGDTLPLDPVEAVRRGSAAGVELLIGTNRDEGAYFIRQGAPVLKREETVALLQQFGFNRPQELSEAYEVSNDGQAELVTDLIFWGPAIRLAEAQLPHSKVWMYRFDWCLPGHPHPLISKSVHALEIAFVFRNLFFLEAMGSSINAAVQGLAERMQRAWIRFATSESEKLADWEAYDLEQRETMVFNSEDGRLADPYAEKRLLLVRC
ncbi:carboxylesterase/lipase family protein [Gorillibacterium timonense]|uniref:carboxylesterase/lipase family protein n=1 Tax=Gorillibacterium timonense TaxID=1689269 RepID=UPI00071E27CE|nr:carboxylesterase/lipase family protein [Gorillibacterium timonense]